MYLCIYNADMVIDFHTMWDSMLFQLRDAANLPPGDLSEWMFFQAAPTPNFATWALTRI